MIGETRYGRTSAATGRPLSLLPAGLALVATLQLLAGGWLLWQPRSARLQATTGVLLILLAVAQFRLANRAAAMRTSLAADRRWRSPLAGRWLLSLVVVSYGVCLFGLPQGERPVVFALLLAAIYTGAVAVWIAEAKWAAAAVGHPLARTAGWTLFAALLLPLGAEAGLRLYTVAAGDVISQAYFGRQLRLQPGCRLGGQQVNELGYWDDEFSSDSRSGLFRVAALGDDQTLCGDCHTNFVARIEREVPGVEVCHFGIPAAAPRDYADQAAPEAARLEPDLVMTFVSVGDDITHETPLPGPFDARSLQLVQLAALGMDDARGPLRLVPAATSAQTYLRHAAARMAVCRTPIDDRLRGRWQKVFGHLDELVESCRRQELPLALVLVPAEFQVNPQLCEVLRRRAGLEPNEVDLNLPQRRLTSYAREHNLLLLDLLPYLRAEEEPAFARNAARLSERGQAVTAEVVGHWMRSHFGNFFATADRLRR